MKPTAVDPINSFQRDDMSLRARRARRDIRGRTAAVKGRRPDLLGPTKERSEKPDHPVKTAGGFYRAPMPIERLRDQNKLDPLPHLNQAMYEASEKLVGYYEGARLVGVKAQDLTRVSGGGGDNDAPDRAEHCRAEFRKACVLMGWPSAFPHRGAGRLTVAVVCEGHGVKQAADLYRPGGSDAARLGAGMDALREGLFALAVHWRLVRG